MLSRGYLATYPCRGTRNTGVVARELLAVHTSRSGTRRLADRSLSLRATNNDGQRAHGEEKELEKAAADMTPTELPADLVSLAQAEARVMAARAALEDFERGIILQSELEQSRAASERGALADLQAAEQELARAELEMGKADSERRTARGKDTIIGLLFSGDASPQKQGQALPASAVDQDAERIESAKAATISAAAGSLAALPLTLVLSDSLVTAAGIFVSCALFGVVYRYAVRSDFENTQLKLGCTAAFGLVRGLGQAETFLRADTQAASLGGSQEAAFLLGHSFSVLAQAALCVGESVVVFLWTGAVLEALMVRGLVLPFGTAGQNPPAQAAPGGKTNAKQ